MRHYEVMVILDPGLEEEDIRAVIDRATQAIADKGGTVHKVDRWGKRRFAYDVHHRSEGYYLLLQATAEPAAVDSVDRMLSLADQVIRHKVIRVPDKVVGKPPAKLAGDPEPAEPKANGAN